MCVRLSRLVCVRVCVCLCVGDEAEQDWVHKTNANKTETRNAVRKGGRARLDVAWRGGVMVPQRDQIQIWIRRADTPTVPIQSWGHTQIRQRYTQHRHAQNQKQNALLPLTQMAMTSLTSLRTSLRDVQADYAVPEQKSVRSTFALVLLDHIRPQPASQKKQYLRICSYLGRLPLSTRPEKRLDKTVGRAWPSSEYPKLSPNKSKSGPPQGCHRR